MRNRLMLCLAALIVCIPGAWGQNANTNWDNLKQIARGRRVHVVETSLRSTDGKFVSFSDSELVLEVNKAQVTISREKVFRVSEDHRRGRKALIAGLVGAGIGAGVGAATSNQFDSSGEKAAVVLGGMAGWGGIFAGISALVTRNPTVYRAQTVPAADANAAK